ncbi:MAG: hypothetical protein HZA82_06240 [Thaumarchaeota archaeon]|nr:hypothetical protein [Nitrososphaerota archaeon]
MDDLKQRLAQKGWSQKEIDKTAQILSAAEEKKSKWVVLLDNALIWVVLLIAVFGNFVLSVVLVPFLVILSGGYLYLSLLVFGVSFGLLFSLILRSSEGVKEEQHIMANVFIPVVGLINMYIIARLCNKLILILQFKSTENSPALVSMIYMFAFLLPYLVMHYFQEFSNHKKIAIA